VLDELVAGRTNAEIALRLGVSPETVKTHVARLLANSGCADRQALARWWQGQATRRPALAPLFRFAGRSAAVIAALALGVLLLVAGVPAVARVVSSVAPGRSLVTAILPPDIPPSPMPIATPTPTLTPTPKPGIPLPVTFLWAADGEPDALNGVRDFAVDATGNVYVQDVFHHRIVKFDAQGRVLARWGSEGSGPGQFVFLHPTGRWTGALAVAPDGTLYVADYSGRVQHFDGDGRHLGEWGSNMIGAGQILHPSGMAIDGSGRIYIADADRHRIQVFDGVGTLLVAWGRNGHGPGELNSPHSLAIAPDGSVYVSDSWNHRVQHFDAQGNYLGEFGSHGLDPGQFVVVSGVAVDAAGNLYVGDNRGGHRIQHFDAGGQYLGEWGSYGYGDGQFENVGKVALDGQGHLYVADQFNNRIQKFRLP
jgi:DNA-binding beta-propeller fold protein YncE